MKKICYSLFFLLSACMFTPQIGQDLIGKNKTYVKKTLGNPTVSRTEKPNQIWAYRIENCSLLIYFDKEEIVQFIDHSGDCP